MAEKRTFTTSICVKTSAKTAYKIELFPAEQWLESSAVDSCNASVEAQQLHSLRSRPSGRSAQGRYRLRINRRWHDLPEGGPVYLDMHQIGALVAGLASGGAPELEPQPELPRKTRVLVPNGRVLAGVAMYDASYTGTEPIRAYDGRWYVEVYLYSKGSIMVPVNVLKRRDRK